MDVQARIKELQKRKEELLKEQQSLVDDFKAKHPEFYTWMVENNISIKKLAQHSVEFAAALLLTINPGEFKLQTKNMVDTPQPDPVLRIIEPHELSGLKEEEKLKLVKERYGFLVERTAKKYNLDPKLIYATIMIESGGNTYAMRQEPQINDASYGLGQILYGTARSIGFEGTPQQLFDPEISIDLIGKYHKRNLDVYGGKLTPHQLTIAYNSGSPYNAPHPGHMSKFENWFEKVGNLMV